MSRHELPAVLHGFPTDADPGRAACDGGAGSVKAGRRDPVMVVDDDPSLRASVRRALERRGHAVGEARGGRDALAQLCDGLAVSFIVTDLRMADGSGGWLLAQLGYDYPHLLERTVVMAGDAAGAAAAHLAARWHCPVLTKPFSAPQLSGALARLGLDDE